jgi:hypothetical protein
VIVRRIFAATTAVVTMAGIVTACSAVPDISFGDEEEEGGSSLPDTGPGKADTGPFADATNDVSTDAPTDAPADVGPCVPTNGGVEDCDDGLDNDCNGKTDCADPACDPTHTCIATPPNGWSLVGEADDARPACPAEYPTATDLDVVAGTGAGTCSCDCSPTVPAEACNAQTSTVRISGVNTCNGADTTQSVFAAQGACSALTSPIAVPNGQSFGKSTPPAAPTACGAATQITTVPPITAGRTCAPTAAPTFGIGCGVGQVCARKASAGLALCVQKSGTIDACPGTYPARKTAGSASEPVDAGPDADDGGDAGAPATVDNRTCNACACNTPSCTATVTLYENANCSGSTTGALGAACGATTNKNFTALAFKSATSGTGCSVAAGFNTATAGAISFTGPTTICCP